MVKKKWIVILYAMIVFFINLVNANTGLILKSQQPAVKLQPTVVANTIHRAIPSTTLQRVQFVYQVYHLLESTVVKL